MSAFVDLYAALWNRFFGVERYAKRKDLAGQQMLFGGEEPPPTAQQPAWSATGYRGTGRNDQGGIYKHGPGAVFSDADYFAFTPEAARRYGPKIEQQDVSLQNPRHITNDQDWHDLTAAASVNPKLNLGSQNPELIRQAADQLSSYLRRQGHDGLVVSNTEKTKWPYRIFGHDQIVKFRDPQTDMIPSQPSET